MTSIVANHAHCQVCGRAVQFGERICSTECQKKVDAQMKQHRRMKWIMFGLLGAGLAMMVLGSMQGGA